MKTETKREREIRLTCELLAERGLDSRELCEVYSPQDIIDGCNSWAKRVGIVARGSSAVSIATGRAYPGLFARLFPIPA